MSHPRRLTLHRLTQMCPPWVLRRAAPILDVAYVDLLIAAGHLTPDDISEWRSGRVTTSDQVTTRG